MRFMMMMMMMIMRNMIAGRKVGEVRGTRRPSVSEQRAPSAETQKNLRLVFWLDGFCCEGLTFN